MKTIVTFPHFGFYTPVLANLFGKFAAEIVVPDEITEKIIKKGVRCSPEMVCFPFKVTLGSLMDSLEKGANTIVHFDSGGQCRFRHYWIIQKHILEEQGYKFKMIPLRARTLLQDLKSINQKTGYLKILGALKSFWNEINEAEKARDEFNLNINKNEINILIFGDIYSVLEYSINFNLVEKLRKYGAVPKMMISLSNFLKEAAIRKKPKFLKEAKQYINGPIGGYGLESIAHTLYAAKHGFDGVLHVAALSCMPEVMVEPIINSLCQKNGLGLLRLAIDETNSELNLETRLETFIEIIKRKKYAAKSTTSLVRH